LKKIQIGRGVNAFEGAAAKVLRGLHRAQFAGVHPLQDVIGTRRHFEARHQLPVHQLATAVMQVVIV
jgi:hypothetical protein